MSARTPEDDKLIADLRAAWAECPEPPWFAADDPAEDTIPHRHSGLALVDTGRTGDGEWPIARLCEWNTARFIAACGEGVPALLNAYDADRALIAELTGALRDCDLGLSAIILDKPVGAQIMKVQDQVRAALARADAAEKGKA